MATKIAVVSTAYAPESEHRNLCRTTVWMQTIYALHVYIDARESGGACAENLSHVIHQLDPTTIVLWVDGDDWLAHEHVIERVLREYAAGAWLTWGQFVYDSGQPGWAADANPTECRRLPWYFTHLKTFRAGLFQQISTEDLHAPTGRWVERAVDQAVMFPMLEMAAERSHFIPDVLYVYSGRHTTGPEADEITEARRIRAMQPYPRLEKAPW